MRPSFSKKPVVAARFLGWIKENRADLKKRGLDADTMSEILEKAVERSTSSDARQEKLASDLRSATAAASRDAEETKILASDLFDMVREAYGKDARSAADLQRLEEAVRGNAKRPRTAPGTPV